MDDIEFKKIINKIIKNRKFKKLKQEKHHYTNDRFDHCLDVAFKTYKICKKFNLDYKNATKAALMHDFFLDNEIARKNKFSKLFQHPKYAIKNANKIERLNDLEMDIISSHMFPIGGTLPKYKESIIVDFVDDIVSTKERFKGDYKKIISIANFLFLILINLKLK